jgi:hypothetical protein
VLITASVWVALFAGAVYAVTLIPPFPSFNVSIGRRHLHQIPIKRSQACGDVEAIHAQLDAFSQTYMAAQLGIDATAWRELWKPATATATATAIPQAPPWPVIEAEVDGAAQLLDAALVNGIPHFPRRIQAELRRVRDNLALGRMRLAIVHDRERFTSLTRVPFARGKLHAGYASDLVGRQCRVPLGA